MPIPLSLTVSVPAVLSTMILIFHSPVLARMSLFVSDSWRALSMASEAFEISSRRNISYFEFSVGYFS